MDPFHDKAGDASSYLIVGAGVFGASTALHLKKDNPGAVVTLVDRACFPNPTAASSDLNKIIRADYRDIMYMKLALEALEQWKNSPLFSPYFHETGMLFAEDAGKGASFLENFRMLGLDPGARLMPIEEVCRRFPGLKDANWKGVDQAYYNPRSGWAEATPALRDVIQLAIDSGVEFVQAEVERVLVDGTGHCTGVMFKDIGAIVADRVVLCTGAGTSKLLADSVPNNPSFQVEGRLVAAAAVSCAVQVPEEMKPMYENSPVLANIMGHTRGEAIPLTPDGMLKVNYELSFTNLEYHAVSRQMISSPPAAMKGCTWTQDVPETFKWETRKVLRNTFGRDIKAFDFASYRICWDTVTANQDFIISPLGHCDNLFVATGGSFHGWKFLPVIGKYVVQMLHGVLDEEKSERWAWDRAHIGAVCDSYIPMRDLKDIMTLERERSKV